VTGADREVTTDSHLWHPWSDGQRTFLKDRSAENRPHLLVASAKDGVDIIVESAEFFSGQRKV
jgi:hypothetical protein